MSRQYNNRPYNKQHQVVYEYVAKEDQEQKQEEKQNVEKQQDKQQDKQNNNQQRSQNQQNYKEKRADNTQKQRQQYNNNQYNKQDRDRDQQNKNYNERDQQRTQFTNNIDDNDRKQQQKQNYKEKNQNQKRFQQRQQQDNDYKRDDNQLDEDNQTFDITKIKQKELTNALIKMLKYRKIECPICYDKIYPNQKIWSCTQCYQPFHLSCIHKWIKNLNSKQSLELFCWSCPKCNMLYQDKLPEYKCFCTKQLEPEADSYSIPHSCSQKCGKKRGQFCPHPCPIDCHPGPCPECHVSGVEIYCFCRKKTKSTQCSEVKKDFSCGQQCGKLLNCQKHQCTKTCHNGVCLPCQENHEIQCYCLSEKKIVNCALASYSCGRVCTKILDCGNHQCLEKCHPKCDPCKLKPELVTQCACGKFSLNNLLKEPRKSCLDPIPNCGLPIEKILPCGHKSRTICGQEFPECLQKVKQKCRCGDSTRVTTCNDKSIFVCDDVCKKRKSCGVHFCQNECCPPNNPEAHLCLKVCNKPLVCGQHNCDQFCHIGACKPCPITITQPITCPCGANVKNPPQKCGTAPPPCMEICKKLLQCGHNCKSLCHQGGCPACLEQVDKECRCKKSTVTTTCSKVAVCRLVCNKILDCGHKCQEICQAPEQCPGNNIEGCGQRCNSKKICGHLCQELCHPNKECPKQPCKIQIRIVCICGNRDTFTECGVVDEQFEKTLKCDQKCQNIKRFGAFYKSNSLVDVEKTYYPDILLKYTHYNLQQLQKMEEKIEYFLVNSKPEDSYNFSFPRTDWAELKKLALQTLLSRHYKFDVQIMKTQNKQYSFSLFKTLETNIPKVKLSDYFIKVQKGIIKRDHVPFKAKIKTLYDITNSDQSNIDNVLSDFKGNYYFEKQGLYYVINFWDEVEAESALKKLKKAVGFLNATWILEMNQQSLEEDKRILEPAKENDFIVKPKKLKQCEYEEKSLEISYTKQEEERFKKIQEQYWEKAQLTQKCDDEEIEERIRNQNLSIFEEDGFYQYEFQPRKQNMVRCFHQIQKPFTPEYVRTPDTLHKTVDFLLFNFLEADDPTSNFKKPIENDQIRNIEFEDVYQYIHDRLQQIVIELNYLQYKEDDLIVKIIRFYILSHSQLKNNEKNLENLVSLLLQFQNEETIQYNLILACFDFKPLCSQFISHFQQIKEQESHQENIIEILKLVEDIHAKKYHQYLQFYQKLENVQLESLTHGFMNEIRKNIINQLSQLLPQNQENQIINSNSLIQALNIESKEDLIIYFKILDVNIESIEEQFKEKEEIDIDLSLIISQLQKKKPYGMLDIDRLVIFK